jgi:hypothetical protein
VHRAAHEIAVLTEGGGIDEHERSELFEHPGQLIETDDPVADRRAAQEIVTMLTEAYGL